MDRMQEYALVKRVEATERAVAGLFEERARLMGILEALGDRVTLAEARSKLALAEAASSRDVPQLRAEFEYLDLQLKAKYSEAPRG